jgi:branched-chain amino acid transport system substrate-binding protein
LKRLRSAQVIAVVALLVSAASACSKNNGGGASPTPSASQKVAVTVYFQGAWTGPYNYLIIPAIQGAQLRAKELNADPSFPATITVGTADTQGNPDQAPPVVQTVMGDPKTVAVIGPAFSGETRASGDSYEQAKIPFVTPSATAVDITQNGWKYFYQTIGNDALQGGNDGKFMAKYVKATKLFVANDKEDYGQGLGNQVADAAKAAGVDVVGNEGIAPTDDYSALISSIKASGADSVFYGGYDADFAKIVKQATDAGLNVKWMSGDGSVSTTFLTGAGPAADGVYLSIASNLGGDFAKKYNDAYGSKASAVPVYAAEGYDCMSLIGEGIKEAIAGGKTAPTDIREGIHQYLDTLTIDNPFEGVAKPIAFDPTTHALAAADLNSLLYFYVVKDGKITQIGNAATVLGA